MRFTIRDLLWLTLLAAVLVAWWVDRSRMDAKYQRVRDAYGELAKRIEELENVPTVYFDP